MVEAVGAQEGAGAVVALRRAVDRERGGGGRMGVAGVFFGASRDGQVLCCVRQLAIVGGGGGGGEVIATPSGVRGGVHGSDEAARTIGTRVCALFWRSKFLFDSGPVDARRSWVGAAAFLDAFATVRISSNARARFVFPVGISRGASDTRRAEHGP